MRQCVFRLDCGSEIGMGHAVRCLSIASALASVNISCSFAVSVSSELSFNRLASGCYPIVIIPDGKELFDVFVSANISSPSILLVDHYGRGRENFKESCFSSSYKILIDDFTLSNSECDLFINPNTLASAYECVGNRCLLGPSFAPLRKEISTLSGGWRPNIDKGEPLECIISIGATDPQNLTERILNTLIELPQLTVFQFSIILSSSAPHVSQIQSLCQSLNDKLRVSVFIDPSCMGELYSRAHCCIGAAGSSAWERSCIGLPTAQLVVADNQKLIQSELADRGAIFPLVHPDDFDFKVQVDTFLNMANSCSERFLSLSDKAKKLVDGKGAYRIVQAIKNLEKL